MKLLDVNEIRPVSDQILIIRKRMRGLYNGFDTYVSKVSTILNYIPALQTQIESLEVSFVATLVPVKQ